METKTPDMTFLEFLGRMANDWDDPAGEEWQKQYLTHLFDVLKTSGKHNGDCTKKPYTCDVCFLTSVLNDWDLYTFNRAEFITKHFSE